jgi:hypothetical protein
MPNPQPQMNRKSYLEIFEGIYPTSKGLYCSSPLRILESNPLLEVLHHPKIAFQTNCIDRRLKGG